MQYQLNCKYTNSVTENFNQSRKSKLCHFSFKKPLLKVVLHFLFRGIEVCFFFPLCPRIIVQYMAHTIDMSWGEYLKFKITPTTA
jgi:hypothetical protein